MRLRKLGAIGSVAAVLCAAPLPSAPVGARGTDVPCKGAARRVLASEGAALETLQLYTLHVEAKPLKKTYKIGEVAKFAVTVTRPAKEDPLGSGVPMDAPVSEAAADVSVGVGISLRDTFVAGYGITDADGKTVVPVRLASYAKPAKALVSLYAYKTDADTPCLRIDESGFRQYPGMITVKR